MNAPLKFALAFGLSFGFSAMSFAGDISVSVDASAGVKKISPYIYGRNIDGFNDTQTSSDETELKAISLMNESGIRMIRANQGNNATKYNWQKKLTSHPDWYNNVYDHDWDITAKKIQDKVPGANAMYAFQLAGYAASSKSYNFDDWNFNQTHNGNWANGTLNLAGGGTVADDGLTLTKKGDYSKYTEPWSADQTVGIINHWKNDLNYDMSRFRYWSMDNEMDIWADTHDDLPLNITPDFLVERYIDVAKKARAAWPDIKLTGPVVANEWFWCSVAASDQNNNLPKGNDRNYCWLEYFIKKVAEAQKASGKRLLDMVDIHWYPTEKNYEDQANWHRVFFDENYEYPGANGIKLVNGSWDDSQKKEYIFKRINGWLDKYFGVNHGITLGLTETDIGLSKNAMTTAIIYASFLGTFMDNGVEMFTPWTWNDGMYEVVHLFSRYNHDYRVKSVSSNDAQVSAYTSVTAAKDSMTVVLVNRDEYSPKVVDLSLSNFDAISGAVKTLSLSKLSGETFVSHSNNALKAGTANLSSGKLSVTVPAKSIMSVIIPGQKSSATSSSSGLSSSSSTVTSSSSSVPSSSSVVASSSSNGSVSSSSVAVASSSSLADISSSSDAANAPISSSTESETSSSSIASGTVSSSSVAGVVSSSSNGISDGISSGDSSTAVAHKTVLSAKLFYSQGSWVLDNSRGSVKRVTLFDNLGKQVGTMNHVAAGNVVLNTEKLNPGMYIVRLEGVASAQMQRIMINR